MNVDNTEPSSVSSAPTTAVPSLLVKRKKKNAQKCGRRVTPIERSIILAEVGSGRSPNSVAVSSGLSAHTVLSIVRDAEEKILSADKVQAARKAIASQAIVNSIRAQDAITDEKLSSASAVQLAVVAKIGTEIAENALRPLGNVGSAKSLVDSFTDYQKELESRLSQLDN